MPMSRQSSFINKTKCPMDFLNTGIVKTLFYLTINGFGVLAVITFFWFKISKKNKEYQKVLSTFNIPPKRNLLEELSYKNYLLPVVFFTVVSMTVSSLFFASDQLFGYLLNADESNQGTFGDNFLFVGPFFGEDGNGKLQIQSIAVVTWAFIGAYLWAASTIVRRLAQSDLTPVVFYRSGWRVLFACAVALAFSFLLETVDAFGGSGGADLRANLPALGLVAGMLPDRFFTYLVKRIKLVFSGGDINTDELSLRNIEGMGQAHRERLWEEGIDNAENLAEASLIQLLIHTPYDARQLLDWIGQAKLLCYMKGDINNAHKVGIRSVFDFVALEAKNRKEGRDHRNALQELGESARLPTPILSVVSDLVSEDVGIQALKHFRDCLNGKEDEKDALANKKEPPKEGDNVPKDMPDSYA